MTQAIIDADFDVEELLGQLSTYEQSLLLAGQLGTTPIPAKKLPNVRFSDGPSAANGNAYFNGPPTNLFPCSMGMTATFDRELIGKIGDSIADQAHAKQIHCLYGPTVNIARSPLSGRGYEFSGEDPHLSGELAAVWIDRVQAGGVIACIKHFVGNEQEYRKHTTDVIVSDRALREIYLEPFRIAIAKSKPLAVMPSYNMLNGTHACENKFLLTDVLRKEWGWEGCTIGDYYGTHSCVKSIQAGLDMEMPEPCFRGPAQMINMLECGKVRPAEVKVLARRVLQLIKTAVQSGIPFDGVEGNNDTPENRALLRRAAADAVVLLKNDARVLPLKADKVKKLAVIGSAAALHHTSGGGAASVHVEAFVDTPLGGIQDLAQQEGIEVQYAMGNQTHLFTPLISPYLSLPKHVTETAQGVAVIEFWKEQPDPHWCDPIAQVKPSAVPDHSLISKTAKCLMMDGAPRHIITDAHFVKFSSVFIPPSSGDWLIGLTGIDHALLFVDGKLAVDYSKDLKPGKLFFEFCQEEKTTIIKDLQAGESYDIEVRCWNTGKLDSLPVRLPAGLQIGAVPVLDPEQGIEEAVALSASCDATIVVIGLGKDYETEGSDRSTMNLPGNSDKLIEAILAKTPDAVIVIQSGMPTTMKWEDRASTVVQAFYGGTAVGHGIADVLFGRVNPSAKLPMSFPKLLRDHPSGRNFGEQSPLTDKVIYAEDIYVGYRHFDSASIKPRFAFGHGLSYTSFEYSNLVITKDAAVELGYTVTFDVKNVGEIFGRESVQLYVRDLVSRLPRPYQELKAFDKVALESGETKQVVLQLNKHAFKYWDDQEDGSWVVEKGEFEIAIAASSIDIRLTNRLHVEHDLKWRGL